MTKASITIRNLEPGDVESALKLSDAVGWNQTRKDWELFINADENLSLAAVSHGQIVATTTAINYANEVAWIGMVLVDKDYRGQGISKLLLRNIFEKLRHCRSIKLDATPDGQAVYKKLGFEDEYHILRMINAAVKIETPADANTSPELLQPSDAREIIELDEFVFGANRKQLINALINNDRASSWVLKRDNQVTGFVLGRNGRKCHQVGPCVASTIADARILIGAALKNLNGQPVVMDIPADKEDLLPWLSTVGFIEQRQFTRMYKNENPLPGITRDQYLIAGPEFG